MNDLTMCFVSVCVWRWRCLYHVTGEVRWRRGGDVRGGGGCIDRLTASAQHRVVCLSTLMPPTSGQYSAAS